MTDAELNLKLARMQGESQVSIRAHRFGGNVREVPIDDALDWVCKHNWHLCFDAVHNGADFDAVLWFALTIAELGVAFTSNDVAVTNADGALVYHKSFQVETQAEFRRAVCEAIVEAAT